MKMLKNIMFVCLIVLASVYLTFFIDVYTLNTLLKKIFIFVYFIIMCLIAIWLKRKLIIIDKRKIINILSIVIASFLLIVFQNTFLPIQQETDIYISAKEFPNTTIVKEVWLTDIVIDGNKVPLNSLQVQQKDGWLYNSEYDDFVFYPSENIDNLLSFNVVAKNVDLLFESNAWSGCVEVSLSNHNGEIYDLQTNDGRSEIVTSKWQTAKQYTLFERIIYNFGATVVLAFLVQCIAQVLMTKKNKLLIISSSRNTFITLIVFSSYILIIGILFCFSEKIVFDNISVIVLILGSILGLIVIWLNRSKTYMQKYQNLKTYIMILLVSLYGSFAMFGHQLFLQGNERPDVGWINLLYLLVGTIWFIPIIISMLWLLESLSMRITDTTKIASKATRRKATTILFSVLACCQMIICSSFWPGGFPSDTLDQLNQAILGAPLNDWHPVLHTLLLRLIYIVYPNPGLIIIVQMLLFALLCTLILMLGYDQGIKLNKLCLFGIVFLLLPNQVISGIGAVKDFPYTIALLWGTYLLLRLLLDFDVCKTKWFALCFTIDLFLIYGLRHNGILPVLFMVVLAIYITLKYYKVIRFWLIGSVIVALLCMGLYKGPLFLTLDVKENTASMYTTMFCAVGSCVNKDMSLSEESTVILESVMSLEDWANYYSRFEGHDKYVWGRESNSSFDLTHISVKQAFYVYLEALIKYPDIIIKDRLDGTDILWNIRQPVDSFNVRGFDQVHNFAYTSNIFDVDSLAQYGEGNYYNNSYVAEFYRNFIYHENNELFDGVLWRAGIYVILFLVLIIFWHENNMLNMLLITTPLLGNIAGSLLVLYHQSFRYVYFVQVIVIALLFVTICLRNSWGNKNTNLNESERDILC